MNKTKLLMVLSCIIFSTLNGSDKKGSSSKEKDASPGQHHSQSAAHLAAMAAASTAATTSTSAASTASQSAQVSASVARAKPLRKKIKPLQPTQKIEIDDASNASPQRSAETTMATTSAPSTCPPCLLDPESARLQFWLSDSNPLPSFGDAEIPGRVSTTPPPQELSLTLQSHAESSRKQSSDHSIAMARGLSSSSAAALSSIDEDEHETRDEDPHDANTANATPFPLHHRSRTLTAQHNPPFFVNPQASSFAVASKAAYDAYVSATTNSYASATAAGAVVSARTQHSPSAASHPNRRLIKAAQEGNVDELRKAITDKADINHTTNPGTHTPFNAFAHAVFGGHSAIVDELMQQKANPYIRVNTGLIFILDYLSPFKKLTDGTLQQMHEYRKVYDEEQIKLASSSSSAKAVADKTAGVASSGTQTAAASTSSSLATGTLAQANPATTSSTAIAPTPMPASASTAVQGRLSIDTSSSSASSSSSSSSAGMHSPRSPTSPAHPNSPILEGASQSTYTHLNAYLAKQRANTKASFSSSSSSSSAKTFSDAEINIAQSRPGELFINTQVLRPRRSTAAQSITDLAVVRMDSNTVKNETEFDAFDDIDSKTATDTTKRRLERKRSSAISIGVEVMSSANTTAEYASLAALIEAADSGNDNSLAEHLAKVKDKNGHILLDGKFATAFMCAAAKGHTSIIQKLMAQNAHPFLLAPDGSKMLNTSILDRIPHSLSYPVLFQLIEYITKFRASCPSDPANKSLLKAAKQGNVAALRLALAHGANKNHTITIAELPSNAFTRAIYYGHELLIDELIAQRADPFIKYKENPVGVLDFVAQHLKDVSHIKPTIVAKIKKYVTTVLNNKNLIEAAAKGDLKKFTEACAEEADINFTTLNEQGRHITPLSQAILNGSSTIISKLIQLKAHPYIKIENQCIPLGIYMRISGYFSKPTQIRSKHLATQLTNYMKKYEDEMTQLAASSKAGKMMGVTTSTQSSSSMSASASSSAASSASSSSSNPTVAANLVSAGAALNVISASSSGAIATQSSSASIPPISTTASSSSPSAEATTSSPSATVTVLMSSVPPATTSTSAASAQPAAALTTVTVSSSFSSSESAT